MFTGLLAATTPSDMHRRITTFPEPEWVCVMMAGQTVVLLSLVICLDVSRLLQRQHATEDKDADVVEVKKDSEPIDEGESLMIYI